MSTTNTSFKWYWYVRNVGNRGYLGIIDENGDAPSTASLDIDVWHKEFPDEITSDDDAIGIPQEYLFAIAKGLASEVIKATLGTPTNLTQQFDIEYERVIYDALHDAINASGQPAIQMPINLRANE